MEGLLVLEVGDVFLLARESCTLESISCNIFGENLDKLRICYRKEVFWTHGKNLDHRLGSKDSREEVISIKEHGRLPRRPGPL